MNTYSSKTMTISAPIVTANDRPFLTNKTYRTSSTNTYSSKTMTTSTTIVTAKDTVKSICTRNDKFLLPLALPTSTKKICLCNYYFFTILRAAWLLHPSQIEQQSPHLSLASALTIAASATTEIKNSPSVNSLSSKH